MSNWPLLLPLTEEAKSALNGREQIKIDKLPFRIGRESRMAFVKGEMVYMERRKGGLTTNNELYLLDDGELLNISREHLQIERGEDGGFRIHDRGSACGTQVDGHAIGGRDTPGSAPLYDDSEIIIGTPQSPYRFTVRHLQRLADSDAGANQGEE